MSGETCALVGCSEACASAKHLACGELHHLLLMAGRYNAAHPHPYHCIRDRNESGLCALPSCSKAPLLAHPWCSRTHYLSWLSSFYASLSPLQICKLPGCPRHVYVFDTDDTPPSEFCGWRHCQKFVMLNGRQPQLQYQPPFDNEKKCDHVPCVKSIMHEFKHFALNGVPPESVRVDYKFFTKHPWEVLAEHGSCYLIARCNWRKNSKQRDMVTKDQYHWKQQGSPKEQSGYCTKYFSYRKLEGKKEKAFQYQDESSYTMTEYVMDDVELYSIVKICKGRKTVRKVGKRCKRGSDLSCSQSSVTSKLDSSICVDDLFLPEAFLEDQRDITDFLT